MSDTPIINASAREDTLKIVKGLEQQVPVFGKMYSNMYHAQIQLFKYWAEATYADRHTAWSSTYGKTVFDWWSHLYANGMVYNLDMFRQFLQWYSQVRLNGMRNMDEYIHSLMEYYGKVAASPKTTESAKSDDTIKKTSSRRTTPSRKRGVFKKSATRATKSVRRTQNATR